MVVKNTQGWIYQIIASITQTADATQNKIWKNIIPFVQDTLKEQIPTEIRIMDDYNAALCSAIENGSTIKDLTYFC